MKRTVVNVYRDEGRVTTAVLTIAENLPQLLAVQDQADEAKAARDGAVAAQGGAVSAQGGAEAARDAAQDAQALAGAARSAAEAAQAIAVGAKDSALASASAALVARDDVLAAVSDATAARDSALAAASVAGASASAAAADALAAGNSATVASNSATDAQGAATAAAGSASAAAATIAGAVRFDATQSLTAPQKTQARANIGASQISENVRFDAAQVITVAQKLIAANNIESLAYGQAQALTSTQQGQARANTGAGTFQWNWVINGDFTINQRGGVKKPANGVYGYDRWKGHANGIEQVVEALPAGEYTLTWSGGGNGTFGGVTGASPIKATVSGGNTSIVVPEIATKVSLVAGDATAEADPFSPRHIQQELALCQRYFYKMSQTSWRLSGTTSGDIGFWHQLPIPMRTTPAVQAQDVIYSINASALVFVDGIPAGFRSNWASGNATIHSVVAFGFAADAEI